MRRAWPLGCIVILFLSGPARGVDTVVENFDDNPFWASFNATAANDNYGYAAVTNNATVGGTLTLAADQISGDKVEKRGKGGIEIAIPVKIKSRAFQTIFGGTAHDLRCILSSIFFVTGIDSLR